MQEQSCKEIKDREVKDFEMSLLRQFFSNRNMYILLNTNVFFYMKKKLSHTSSILCPK
jgi:hypothetical protein